MTTFTLRIKINLTFKSVKKNKTPCFLKIKNYVTNDRCYILIKYELESQPYLTYTKKTYLSAIMFRIVRIDFLKWKSHSFYF